MRGIPGPHEPIAGTQAMSSRWWSFFSQQFGPQSAQTITPTGSPFIFQAPNYRGVLMVSGGTISGVTYSQEGKVYYPTGQTAGCFPMAGTDFLELTYTVAPTLTYIPI